jgi:flavin reductase
LPETRTAPRTASPDGLDLATQLKRVLRFMPAPVGIITSFDPDDGRPVGLAMSALMPVCLEPAAMAICVNRSGSAYDALVRAGRFCINLLAPGQDAHVTPFADPTARGDRFAQADWRRRAQDSMWYIDDAPANLFCTMRARLSHGTHDLVIGDVTDLYASGGEDILGWANGAPGRLLPLS